MAIAPSNIVRFPRMILHFLYSQSKPEKQKMTPTASVPMCGTMHWLFLFCGLRISHTPRLHSSTKKGSTNKPHAEQQHYNTSTVRSPHLCCLLCAACVISSSLLFISPPNFLAEKIANSGFQETERVEIGCT